VIIEAVNSAAISQCVTKPWNMPQLEMILKRACELFAEQREGDLLAEDDFSEQQKTAITGPDESTGLLTLDQVADYLNVNKYTLYRLLTRKKIPAFKVGNQWRFKKQIIDAWLMSTSNIQMKNSN
jgi:excisionase family DNA binding protein